jgi:hypothetical protein
MSASRLGLRYERLLILTAPISLAAFLVFFVAVASDSQKERLQARCYNSAADVIEKNKEELDSLWDAAGPPAAGYWGGDYKLKIQHLFIYGFLPGKCFDILDSEIDKRYRNVPSHIIVTYRNDAKILVATPLNYYGVEIPEKASLSFIGTTIKIDFMPFTQLLQLILGPLLILWLGSLYNTRYRETLLIGKMKNITDIFPHNINIYPSGEFQSIRKKSWFKLYSRNIIFVLFGLFRMFLVAICVAPPIVAYIASLIFLGSEDYFFLSLVLGGLVFIIGISTLFVEIFPWHAKKLFPSPIEVVR